MKRLLIIFLCCTNLMIFAQEKSFDLGVVSGVGTSFVIANATKPKPNISYGFLEGISFVYNSPSKFIFESNLSYELKSLSDKIFSTDPITLESESYIWLMNFHYLTLSILPGFRTKGNTKFFFNGGLVAGFYMNNPKGVIIPPSRVFDLAIGLKAGIQKDISKKFKLNIFVQNNTTVLNNVIYFKKDLNSLIHNSFLLGLGVYYKIGNKKE